MFTRRSRTTWYAPTSLAATSSPSRSGGRWSASISSTPCASANFLQLQTELVQTEDDIASARRYYNAVARDLNTRRETFPNLIVSGALGFDRAEFFELSDLDERAAPGVGDERRT